MASTRTNLSSDLEPIQARNAAPSGFDPARELPAGFIEFLLPLHRAFTPRQRDLIARRRAALDIRSTYYNLAGDIVSVGVVAPFGGPTSPRRSIVSTIRAARLRANPIGGRFVVGTTGDDTLRSKS